MTLNFSVTVGKAFANSLILFSRQYFLPALEWFPSPPPPLNPCPYRIHTNVRNEAGIWHFWVLPVHCIFSLSRPCGATRHCSVGWSEPIQHACWIHVWSIRLFRLSSHSDWSREGLVVRVGPIRISAYDWIFFSPTTTIRKEPLSLGLNLQGAMCVGYWKLPHTHRESFWERWKERERSDDII